MSFGVISHAPAAAGNSREAVQWLYKAVDAYDHEDFGGAKISLQRHHQRAEHWVVVSGKARITRDEDTIHLVENQSTFIPLGAKHRLENPGTEPLYVIEVQSGSYLGEDDIERFADDYKRT